MAGRGGSSSRRIVLLSTLTALCCVLVLYGLPVGDPTLLGSVSKRSLVDDYPPLKLPAEVFLGTDWSREQLYNESNWFLEDGQKGQVRTYLEHIRLGVLAAAADPTSLLMFSGGETREKAGPRSEAQAYWLVADALNWFGKAEVRKRAFTEEHARDSYENLAFSLCRFRELTGTYATNTTIVSFKFKRDRFVKTHAHALSLPTKSVHFIGADPPSSDGIVPSGESSRAALFADDPHGCTTDILRQKRSMRNPFARVVPYPNGCPELAPLLLHCGPELYQGSVPWTK